MGLEVNKTYPDQGIKKRKLQMDEPATHSMSLSCFTTDERGFQMFQIGANDV